MTQTSQAIADLLSRDRRYRFESYLFVFEALQFAQQSLGRGCYDSEDDDEGEVDERRHVNGRELCEAIRRYALQQFGMLAPSVFAHWGIRKTGDFGEIVFNLIDIGQLRKTETDCREDFDDVFDLAVGLRDAAVFRKPGSDASEPAR
jgi:uncharacterized repeat protein (TIGR04138 family)